MDHEDVLDEVNHEAGKKLDLVEAGTTGGINGTLTPGGISQHSVTKSPLSTSYSVGDNILGLHQAIVSSIFSAGRPDIQAKLFSSIQLVGGVASTKGLVDVIEERVLQVLPSQETIERVEVLPNRTDPSLMCWKGGVVLCVLDFARDAWVQYEDWMEGGIRIGAARKYKDSNSIHAQTFWYSSVLE
ncbi:hypothetical protein O6H91_13G006200 [Diphasiastrum complanatum]|nr:hypothetical protein O6H91_13G006200 [Diphasiastrum complanatum]